MIVGLVDRTAHIFLEIWNSTWNNHFPEQIRLESGLKGYWTITILYIHVCGAVIFFICLSSTTNLILQNIIPTIEALLITIAANTKNAISPI